jgi:HEAT repeat protein
VGGFRGPASKLWSVTPQALTIVVIALYAISILLLVAALTRRALEIRGVRRHDALVAELRGPFEAFILGGAPLPPVGRDGGDALLDLSLRYRAILKGHEAARIVDCLEQEQLIDDLLRRLRARGEWKRAEAAELLGRLRIGRAVGPLVAALHDPSEDVRTVAARSLAAIGDPDAVPALASALADPSRWTLSLVAENLMQMGPDAVQPLLDLLAGDDHNVRVAAVQILGEIRDPAALSALIAVLAGAGNLNLRAQAAAALGRLGGPDAQTALLAALGDSQWQVRAQAAKALGRLGHPAVAARLAAAMPDLNWWVRVNCAEALACLGTPGRTQLERLLGHSDAYVRDQAHAVLEVYGLRERPA